MEYKDIENTDTLSVLNMWIEKQNTVTLFVKTTRSGRKTGLWFTPYSDFVVIKNHLIIVCDSKLSIITGLINI